MKPIDYIIIILAVGFLLIFIGNYIYRKKKNLPTGECACCANKGNNLVKKFRKKYKR